MESEFIGLYSDNFLRHFYSSYRERPSRKVTLYKIAFKRSSTAQSELSNLMHCY